MFGSDFVRTCSNSAFFIGDLAMARRSTWLTVSVATAVTFGLGVPTNAQGIMEGRTAFDNLRAGGGRAPGSMVTAGVARARQTADQGRAQVISPEITETSPTTTIREQFLSDLADIIVQAFNDIVQQFIQMIVSLVTQQLTDAGLMPILSLDDLLPAADSNGADNTNVGAMDTGDLPDQTDGDSDATDTDSTDSGATDGDSTDSATTDQDTTDSGGGRRPGRGGRR